MSFFGVLALICMGVDGTVILKASLDFQKFALHSSGFLCGVFLH
jgi:hypothetical protein